MGRLGTLLKSKSIWGAVLGAGAYLIAQPHVGTTEILTALGPLLSVIGLRDAIYKSGGA